MHNLFGSGRLSLQTIVRLESAPPGGQPVTVNRSELPRAAVGDEVMVSAPLYFWLRYRVSSVSESEVVLERTS
ncbi:MAG: hypothetical protein COU11_04560 [Candidatus Harrisonbacteria bacterium CG10_big_fil_rev_8_21_14_0_10_49_15]|uniref:Uncharacterized protein n=1 Tax=Candidatus Harrisonbacteria bacterium CG10_big_fil_rev_8_21_14_0_10_49_15 TaxID=1974587 RepID=A0A2H0UK33_9BACT|nr:MAG: hypothetical protein COU11_04560 [Candidatus Harrisonbacteria bacterium CG10_big_fil_rev_8_21_14_0_10_49_15]